MPSLRDDWNDCFNGLGAAPPKVPLDDLIARYREPHRAYHTLQHIEECLTLWRNIAGERRGEVGIALFYHDAIYDTHASDSEARSAALAREALNGVVGDETLSRIADLILATTHNAIPASEPAKVLIDIDLSILGAPQARFDEYERQVRREYEWVAENDFRAGRARVLLGFLARPTIYSTDLFRERLEAGARANLERSLRALGH